MDTAPAGTVAEGGITAEELGLAARNHALPLEALRHDLTPAGLHYLLIHYDIPVVDPPPSGSRSAGRWSARSACRSTSCGRASAWRCP